MKQGQFRATQSNNMLQMISFISFLFLIFIPFNATAKPVIEWAPSILSTDVEVGASQSFIVSFASRKDLNNIELHVVPELAPFIEVSPSSILNVPHGVETELTVTFSVPIDTLPDMLDGTIKIRKGKKVISRPLPILLNIIEPSPISYSDLTFYSNEEIASLIGYRNDDGSFVTFHGGKNANGVGTSVDLMSTVESDSSSEKLIYFDEIGRPIKLIATDGTIFEIYWETGTKFLVSILLPDGSAQANVSLDLNNPLLPATNENSNGTINLTQSGLAAISSLSSVIQQSVSERAPYTGLEYGETSSATLQAATADDPNRNLTVNLEQCQKPATGGTVVAKVTPASLGQDGTSYTVYPSETSTGKYEGNFVTFPSLIDPATILSTCISTLGPIFDACDWLGVASPAMLAWGCESLGAGLLAIPGVGLAVVGPAVTACYGAFTTCAITESTGLPPGVPEEEGVCNNITSTIDFFDSDGVYIKASASKGVHSNSTPSIRFLSGDDARLSITLPDIPPSIASFETVPADPAPGASYTATAKLNEACGGGVILMTVTGTDGYSDFTSCPVGSTSCTLTVPGAAEGVQDTIEVTIDDIDARTIQLVF